MAEDSKVDGNDKNLNHYILNAEGGAYGLTFGSVTGSTNIQKINFNLLDNAFSSLEEGVKKFIEGKEENDKAYKFSILHVAHFIELIFKYYVYKQHPLLIYSKPQKPISDDSFTITSDEALQILENCGIKLEINIVSDIRELKKIRNKIEHYEFELDVKRTEEIIGKLIYDLILFDSKHFDTKLNECLEPSLWKKLHELSEAHESKVKLVEEEAKSSGNDVFLCVYCGYETQITLEDEKRTTCLYCKNTNNLVQCCECGNLFPDVQLILWNEEHDHYICEHCEEDFMRKLEKDD